MTRLTKLLLCAMLLVGAMPASLRASEPEPGPLDSLFAKLRSLEQGDDSTVVSILHLGDSHIQAGHLPAAVRRPLQERFGNAGRGWVAPLKLAKTNEPDDYFITSPAKDWIAGKVIQREKRCAIGPGGLGITAPGQRADFNIIIAPVKGAGYAFDRVVAYRSGNAPLAMQTDTFCYDRRIDTLRLRAADLPSAKGGDVFFGFNLTSGSHGVLYHGVGINGAMYVQYTDSAYMAKLATAFKPDLVIVSLGTNETFGRAFRQAEFTEQVRSFVALLRHYLPDAPQLLTTPPETYKRVVRDKKRVYVRNQSSERAAAAIRQVAQEEGLACFDLFEALGGKGSCVALQKRGDYARDRVHFTREGYARQGKMLFDYIIKQYETYCNP
jgi:lysophospholipase L1-like esterase